MRRKILNKLKVFFLVQGQSYSGAEIVLDRYIEGNNKIEPYIVLLFSEGEVIKKYKSKYSNVYLLNLNKFKIINKIFPGFLSKKFWRRIQPILDDVKPNIIYANNTTETMISGFHLKDKKIPMISHIHSMVSNMRNPLKKFGIKVALKKFEKIIAVSNATRDSLQVKRDVSVVYNGLDDNYFDNSFNNETKSNNFHIGYVGSFLPNKAPHILIKAINKLIEHDNTEIKCTIVYNEKNDKYFNNVYSSHVNQNRNFFHFKNNLSRKNVREFYKTIDLLVVPSRHECLPTVIMEAMAMGTLVVGSDVDGIPEMLNDSELLFPDNSFKELASLIKKIQDWDSDYYYNKQLYLFKRSKKLFKKKNKERKINKILNDLYRNR